jgi:hypothetical protein
MRQLNWFSQISLRLGKGSFNQKKTQQEIKLTKQEKNAENLFQIFNIVKILSLK